MSTPQAARMSTTQTRPYAGPDRRRGEALHDRRWRLVLALFGIGWGAGYLLGPASWTTSGSFAVIHDLGVPFPLAGGLVLLLAAGMSSARTVHLAAGLLTVWWAMWATALAAPIVTGQAESWGGPWFAALTAAAHGYQLTRKHSPARPVQGAAR